MNEGQMSGIAGYCPFPLYFKNEEEVLWDRRKCLTGQK